MKRTEPQAENPELSEPSSMVVARARDLITALGGNSARLGTLEVVDGWVVETHTLGCRNHGDDPENQWWDRHWAIYDEYRTDGISTIIGDPADGIFATLTAQKAQRAQLKVARPVQQGTKPLPTVYDH